MVCLFREGISPENTNFKIINGNLVISFTDSNDQITINEQINPWMPGYEKINTFKFSDGATLSFDDLNLANEIYTNEPFVQGTYLNDKIFVNDQTFYIDAGSGNDTVYGGTGDEYIMGGDGDDLLYGREGNDYISAGNGDDTVAGGSGNDYLQGDVGNDTYIINKGDSQDSIYDWEGNDTLKFGEGISVQDLTLSQDNDSLVIGIKDTEDSITIQEYYSDDVLKIENFEFANGTSSTLQEIQDILANTPIINTAPIIELF